MLVICCLLILGDFMLVVNSNCFYIFFYLVVVLLMVCLCVCMWFVGLFMTFAFSVDLLDLILLACVSLVVCFFG